MADDKKQTEELKNKKTEKESGSKTVTKLVEDISKLSVMELSDLVKTLQEKLGISPMVASAPTGQAAQATAPAEGQAAPGQGGGSPTQTLVMTGGGINKIAVIKALREINQNWGLKEAKDMTEQVPVEILKDTKAEEVKIASEKLTAAGATVEIK